jgi:hypothetical protein
MKWQQPELATTINQTRSVLCECIGTRRELTDEIEATYPYFVYITAGSTRLINSRGDWTCRCNTT